MDTIPIICIEGNIGSGKSTLIKMLQNSDMFSNVVFIQEPVELWLNVNGINMIDKFYNNQEKYSFAFQIMAHNTRLLSWKKAIKENPGKIIVSERSLWTDSEIFVELLHTNNKMEQVEYTIYKNWVAMFKENFILEKVIYVNTTPDKCYEHAKKRSRDGENIISLEYLKQCKQHHDNWLLPANIPKLFLSGDVDFEHNKNVFDEYINIIQKFINE
jgi:deoxyadenosine/deoxycytidine kinase